MSSAKPNKNQNTYKQPKYTVKEALVNYYLFVMFTLFPLFFSNKLFNIRHDKLYFFLIATGVVFAAEILIIMTSSLDSISVKSSPKEQTDKLPWYKTLSFTDFAVLVFLAVNIISTLLSDHPYEALFGESQNVASAGRNNGLILIIFYVIAYFLITRFFHYFEYPFVGFACSSAIVFLLAILNCFYIDPLQMLSELDEHQQTIFTSTIGNINILSSFICIALPVMITMSVHTQNNYLRALYLAVSGIGFAALMVADSDSGILGLGVFLVIYLVWYSRRIDRLKRYFLAITVMLIFSKLLRLFSLIMNDRSKGMDTYQSFFVYSNASYILLALIGIITIGLYMLDYKKPGITLSKAVPFTLTAVCVIAAVAVISIIVYFSFIDTTTELGSLSTILRFNDKWGTHRGFMWIRSMWIFGDFSFVDKIFGCGPDTLYFAFSPYFDDLMKFGDSSTNAAHNEYINYLITVGAAGLLAYLAIVGGTITRAVKTAKQNPLAIVCVSAVICYSVQAIVNISQPITTSLFFIFIALCEAFSSKSCIKEQ